MERRRFRSTIKSILGLNDPVKRISQLSSSLISIAAFLGAIGALYAASVVVLKSIGVTTCAVIDPGDNRIVSERSCKPGTATMLRWQAKDSTVPNVVLQYAGVSTPSETWIEYNIPASASTPAPSQWKAAHTWLLIAENHNRGVGSYEVGSVFRRYDMEKWNCVQGRAQLVGEEYCLLEIYIAADLLSGKTRKGTVHMRWNKFGGTTELALTQANIPTGGRWRELGTIEVLRNDPWFWPKVATFYK